MASTTFVLSDQAVGFLKFGIRGRQFHKLSTGAVRSELLSAFCRILADFAGKGP